MNNLLKPLRIGQIIPENKREYPNVKDQRIARIDWNYNGTYYAIYLNRSSVVLGDCHGRSMKSICANKKQYKDCKRTIDKIHEWNSFQEWRQRYYSDYPVWDLDNLYIRFLESQKH